MKEAKYKIPAYSYVQAGIFYSLEETTNERLTPFSHSETSYLLTKVDSIQY